MTLRPHLAPLLLALLSGCGGSGSAAPSTKSPPTTPTTTAAPAPSVTHVAHVEIPPAIAVLVAAPDRSDDDKKLDAGRHPAETLAFFGIAPGMHVGELVSGGGYTTELLARAVGATGVVYGENNAFVLEKFAEKPWSERLAKPVMKNVVRADRELEDPFPPEAHDLDAVLCVLFYHDTVWLKTDRAKMNAAVYASLKAGGVYGIIDHSAKAGTGINDADTLHRIEEKVVVAEITKAGFRLDADASFLRNPSDARDWNDSPKAAGDKRGTSDRFVLRFVKP
jgi:predicted methyltransferase